MAIDGDDLDLLADLECSECGPLVVDGEPVFAAWEVDQGGVDRAIVDHVCPVCGGELDQTLEASLDLLKMVAERFPGLSGRIEDKIGEALGGLDP